MGLFDSLIAPDVTCPCGGTLYALEIQFTEGRPSMNRYYMGDAITDWDEPGTVTVDGIAACTACGAFPEYDITVVDGVLVSAAYRGEMQRAKEQEGGQS